LPRADATPPSPATCFTKGASRRPLRQPRRPDCRTGQGRGLHPRDGGGDRQRRPARAGIWIADQEEWSDIPFVLLTSRGGGLERNPAAGRYLDLLGNVTFLERPFHPTTLMSLAKSALRGRKRQYEARARLEELRDSEGRFRTLFETMDEGFAVIEFIDGPEGPLSDYVHIQANPAYERHTGISDVVGQRVHEMVPDEAAAWVQLYRQVLLTGEPIRFERELVATHRHLELAAFRVEPAGRREVAVIFQDVTARKRAELELLELNQTLERRVEEAVAQREVATSQLHEAQKLETIGQLTGGVAHDINNLLTPITGALDLLSRRYSADDPRMARLLDGALQSAERAKILVSRLLGFARRQALETRAIDPASLLEGMRDLSSARSDRRSSCACYQATGCPRLWPIPTSSNSPSSTCASTRATR
jgi:PAS domain S-box-containing protein